MTYWGEQPGENPQDPYEGMYNIECEQALLGALLLKNEVLWEFLTLKAEDFHEPVHQDIFRAMHQGIIEGKVMNPVTMKHQFDRDLRLRFPITVITQDGEKQQSVCKGGVYLARLAGAAGTIAHAKHFAESIKDASDRRRLFDKTQEVQKALRYEHGIHAGENKKLAEIANELGSVCISVGEDYDVIRIATQKAVTLEVLNDFSGDAPCYSTGMQAVDDALAGGLYEKKSYSIAARPGIGKTTLMATMYTNITHKGVPCMYIAAEMGAKEIHQRSIARLIRESSTAFYTKRTDSKFVNDVVQYSRTEDAPGFYADAAGITFDQLKLMTYHAARSLKVKGIFLDYLGLVEGKGARDGDAQWQEQVAKWIAQVAKRLGIFYVYACQMNRDGHLRGSDGAMMAADVVLELVPVKDDGGYENMAWLRNHKTRYNVRMDIGSAKSPSLRRHGNGPHFKDARDKHDGYVDPHEQKKLAAPTLFEKQVEEWENLT